MKDFILYQNEKGYNNKKVYPFHNDKYLFQLILTIVKNIDCFIETGSYLGKTIFFMGKNFKNIKCYSCEINREYYNNAREIVNNLENVSLELKPSPQFLYDLDKNIFNKKTLFWLDAHWGTDPIFNEIEFITSNFKEFVIIIDDFKIPNKKKFTNDGYCIYQIKPFIKNINKFNYYIPNYEPELVENPVGYFIISTFKFNYNKVLDITKFILK
jgi:hypothetical protein